MACPYSNAGYDKCYVTHLTFDNEEKAYFYCGGGGQHKSCHIYPELVTKDIAALEKKIFLGRGPVLLPEPHRNHFLLFYRDFYSKMQLFIPFLLDGIAKHEKCLYLPLEDYPSQVRIALNGAGIPSDKVDILPAAEWYLTKGKFDAEASQKKYKEAVTAALQDGFTGLRAIGDGGTFLGGIDGEDLECLLSYEEEMHHLLGSLAMKAICAYDLKGLPSESFRRLIGSHHIIGTPLTERQLSYVAHFIPSLEVDEIAYHINEVEKTKLKFINREGVGYLFCETPVEVSHSLESMVDEISRRVVQKSAAR